MENRIYNESNGLWYERCGDYYVPGLDTSNDAQQSIGVWGQRHKRYMRKHRKGMYTYLLLDGKLNRYLADIDRQARELYERLVTELTQKDGITERLKARDQMAWVGRMNNISARAREIVDSETIFV